MTGRRTSDWLRSPLSVSGPRSDRDAGTEGASNECGDRRAQDRRTGDRRAPRRPIDPQFAATLLAQVLPGGEEAPGAYPQARAPRAGIVVNVKA